MSQVVLEPAFIAWKTGRGIGHKVVTRCRKNIIGHVKRRRGSERGREDEKGKGEEREEGGRWRRMKKKERHGEKKEGREREKVFIVPATCRTTDRGIVIKWNERNFSNDLLCVNTQKPGSQDRVREFGAPRKGV